MIIKILLTAGIVAVTLYLMRGRESGPHLAIRRIASVAFAIFGISAIAAPHAVTSVANALGVGRGADLVLYILVISFLFVTVAQQGHLREIDNRIAELTRALALHQARRSGTPDND